MAVRLPIIMVQTRPPSAAAQRRAEEIVGQLIGIHGVDLVLVDPVVTLAESSTDRLTLSALTGDVAVLDWKSQEAMVDELATVGFSGQRAVHEHDRRAPAGAAGLRRIYAFDLTQFSSASEVIGALERLLATRQVRTVSLGLVSPSQSREDSTKPADSPPAPQAIGPSPARPPVEAAEPSPGPQNVDLDDLLDQLDQIDP